MKISFIILTWNSEKYILNCLNSIYNITFYEKQVIIVDNGSTDATVGIIESSFPQIHFIKNKTNYGTTVSRNMALSIIDSDSNCICILDSDTIINNFAIEDLYKVLYQNVDYLIAIPGMVNLNGVRQIACKRFPTLIIKLLKGIPISHLNNKGEKLESYEIKNKVVPYEVDYGISACWMMKREIIDIVGYLDERYFYAPEDVDYCLRVWKSGYKVVYCSQTEIIHDTQRLSKRKFFSKINFEHIKGLCYYFWKHKYLISTKRLLK